jgi:hypothetical protein
MLGPFAVFGAEWTTVWSILSLPFSMVLEMWAATGATAYVLICSIVAAMFWATAVSVLSAIVVRLRRTAAYPADLPLERRDMSGDMTILDEAKKASRDTSECRRTIDALVLLGFDDEAFQQIHTDSIHGFYEYSKHVLRFKEDETNHRVHQRLMYIRLSCPNGVPPKGKSFLSLAGEARKLITPFKESRPK